MTKDNINKNAHINPTYHVVGGTDPHEVSEQFKKWQEYPRQDIVRSVPLQLDIEATSLCDLECPFCFQAYDDTKPAQATMSRELYDHIVSEFAEKGGDSLKMQYRGESLLVKDLEDRVAFASERGLQVRFNTNGRPLTEKRARAMVEAGLYGIIFSIDSHIPEEYNKIRRPNAHKLGDFDKVLNNVRNLRRIRDEYGVQNPTIRVTRVDIPETKESLPDFQDFWLNNGADFVSVVDLNDYSMGKDGDVLVSPSFCCEQPWQRMFVLADGLVTQCCGDLYQKYPLAQIELPSTIANYASQLQEQLNGSEEPGSKVEKEILSAKNKLGMLISQKHVIGEMQEDGSITPTQMRVRGISGTTNVVPLVDNIEDAWLGKKSMAMRQVNRNGQSHKLPVCADCGYRQTVILGKEMEHELSPRISKTGEKHGQIKYMEKGLEGYAEKND